MIDLIHEVARLSLTDINGSITCFEYQDFDVSTYFRSVKAARLIRHRRTSFRHGYLQRQPLRRYHTSSNYISEVGEDVWSRIASDMWERGSKLEL